MNRLPAAEHPAPADSKPTRPWLSSGLITAFALAIGVTPEFEVLGIPKVRLTDLMLPFLLLVLLGQPRPRTMQRLRFLFGPVMLAILAWDSVCLLLLGEANLRPGIFYLLKRAMTFLIAYMGFAAASSKDAFVRIVRGLLWASPILSLSVILDLRYRASMVESLAQGDELRASGIIANQQASTGLFIVIVLCLSIALWPVVKQKGLIMLSLFTGFGALLATGTKGLVISGGTALCVLLALTGRGQRKAPVPLILLAMMLSWFLLPQGLQNRLLGMTEEFSKVSTALVEDETLMPSGGSSSLANRVIIIQYTLSELIPISPLYGFGTGYRQLGSLDNFYLAECVYHGVIGLGLFMLLLYQFYVVLTACLQLPSDSAIRAAACALLAAMCAMLVSGLHSESFYLIRPMEAFMLLVGLVHGGYSVEVQRR